MAKELMDLAIAFDFLYLRSIDAKNCLKGNDFILPRMLLDEDIEKATSESLQKRAEFALDILFADM